MAGTSSGLLDEERDAGASSTNEVADTTLVASGERNLAASVVIGRPVAGQLNVGKPGVITAAQGMVTHSPCIYTLEGTVPLTTTTTTSTTTSTVTATTTTSTTATTTSSTTSTTSTTATTTSTTVTGSTTTSTTVTGSTTSTTTTTSTMTTTTT